MIAIDALVILAPCRATRRYRPLGYQPKGFILLKGIKMNYEEYLDLVVQVATTNLKPGNSQITAAALGTLLHQASPECDWKTFGKRSLLELLREPWFNGKLEISETDKGALAVTPTTPEASAGPQLIEKFNPLRKAMWEAFVLTSPSGRRFVNRNDGSVRSGLEIAPTPADDWVEIRPISTESQYEWAREFAANHTPPLEAPPQAQNWNPHAFNAQLKQVDEVLAQQWNRFRSARVSLAVKQWITENSLPVEWAFQKSLPSHKIKPLFPREDIQQAELSPDETRRVIISALSSLPLEQLLEIPIPARLILAALPKSKTR